MYKKKKKKVGKTRQMTKLIFKYISNVNVFEMLFKSIHLETDLEEEHEQILHN